MSDDEKRLSVAQLRSRFETVAIRSVKPSPRNIRPETAPLPPIIIQIQQNDSEEASANSSIASSALDLDSLISKRAVEAEMERQRLEQLEMVQADEEFARRLQMEEINPRKPTIVNTNDIEIARRLQELFKHEEEVERQLQRQEEARLGEIEARRLQMLLEVEDRAAQDVALRKKREQEQRDAELAMQLHQQFMEEVLAQESNTASSPLRPPLPRSASSPSRSPVRERMREPMSPREPIARRASPANPSRSIRNASPSSSLASNPADIYTYLGMQESDVAMASSQLRSGSNVRHHAIADAYVSEHAFFHSIFLLCKVWPEKLASIGIPKPTCDRIFAKTELNSMLELHRTLFCNLHQAILQGLDPFEPSFIMIGQIFLDLKQRWSVYMKYIQAFDLADMTVTSLDKMAKFKRLDERCSRDPDMKNRTLKETLMIPIQRLQRYPLVLKEILKHTNDGHDDFHPLTKALEQMNALASVVDTVRDLEEQRRRLILAWSQTESFPAHLLSATKRKWLAEADVLTEKPVEKRLHLFLLSDCLIIAKRLKSDETEEGKKFKFLRALDLRRVELCPVTEDVNPCSMTIMFIPTTTVRNQDRSPVGDALIVTLNDDVSCFAEEDDDDKSLMGSLMRKKSRLFSKPETLPVVDSSIPEVLRFIWEQSSQDLYPEKSRESFERLLEEEVKRLERFGLHL